MNTGTSAFVTLAVMALLATWQPHETLAQIEVVTGGDVGINTSSPTAKLDVNGLSRFRDTVTVGDSGSVKLVSVKSSYGDADLSGNSIVFTRSGNSYISQTGDGALVFETGSPLAAEMTIASGGGVYADGFYSTSDARLKRNVRSLDSAVAILSQLQGVSYERVDADGSSKPEVGFIAQDVEKVLPSAVGTNQDTGFKAVAYERIIPILVEAVKEQQKTIETLQVALEEVVANAR